jgi:hypothetical protein
MSHRRLLTLLTPAVVARDDFAAADTTAITSLAPPWTKHAVAATNTAAPAVAGGRIHGENAATISVYHRADWAPASPDYAVVCDVVPLSDNDLSEAGPVGRVLASANTMYMVRYNQISNIWQLFKFVNGTATQLGASIAQTLTVGQRYVAALVMAGTTIAMRVDGVTIVAVGDTAIPAAGLAGVRIQNAATSTTGLHLGHWRVEQ